MTTIFSNSLIYLLDQLGKRLQEDFSTADFLLESHQVQKDIGGHLSTGLFSA
jgi:hypothetical protein